MKKVLALILAVAMLATLNVGALAGGPPPVTMEDIQSGNTLEVERPAEESVGNSIPVRLLIMNNLPEENVTISFPDGDFDFEFVKKTANYESLGPDLAYNALDYLAKPKPASVATGKRLNGTIKVDYFYKSDRKFTEEFTITMPAIIKIFNAEFGETIKFSESVNYMSSAMGNVHAIGHSFEYNSLYDITAAACKNGFFAAEIPEENLGFGKFLAVRSKTLYTNASDVGKVISDVLTVKLSNGKNYEFPIEMRVSDEPFEDLDRAEPCLNAQDTIFNVMIGTTYHYTIKMFDLSNALKLPLSIEFINRENDNVLEISDVTVNGKEITYTLTPLKEGEAAITHIIKDAEGNSFGNHTETYTVYPEGGIIPDDAHNPDKPKPPVTDPDNPDQPTPPVTDPDNPDKPTPKPPVVDSGAAPVDKTPQATDNPANDDKTTDALRSGDAVELKLTNGSAGLSTDTIDTLGGSKGKLTLQNGGMTVTIPGGFGKVNEPGRIYYPLDFSDSLANAADLAAAVKGEKAKTEVVKAGGDMVMPTTVTVTLKTKLTGTVNVYYYNDTTRRYTLLASPAAKDGKITFATKQMGTMVLTTGTI